MELIERIDFSGAEFIEQDGVRIIKSVSLLGAQSSHGYRYLESAMQEAVKRGLYEQARCFIGHKEGARDLRDLAGCFKNTRFESGKVRGDAFLLSNEPGRLFWEIAQTMPQAAACSHVASGKLVNRNGEQVVESIDRVLSVDLVPDGATNRGLFEGATLEEGVIPKPARLERQFEFVSRCVSQMKAANGSISDDEANAACFCAWQARFEPGGVDENFQPVKPAEQSPTAEAHSATREQTVAEQIAALDALVERGRRWENNSAEGNVTMTTMTERISARIGETEKTAAEIAKVADPQFRDIVREEVARDDHENYLRRTEAARNNQGKAAAIAEAAANTGPESDSEFSQRMRERRATREQTERDAARIAEAVIPPTGALVG